MLKARAVAQFHRDWELTLHGAASEALGAVTRRVIIVESYLCTEVRAASAAVVIEGLRPQHSGSINAIWIRLVSLVEFLQ
jgi:hypothetical protein